MSDLGLFSAFSPLQSHRLRVAYYDQRGVGPSPSPADNDYRPDAYIADLEALRRRLGVERIDLLGDSWGGEVAALYAGAFPLHVGAVVEIGGKPLDPDASSVGMLMFQRRVITLQQDHLVPASIPDRWATTARLNSTPSVRSTRPTRITRMPPRR